MKNGEHNTTETGKLDRGRLQEAVRKSINCLEGREFTFREVRSAMQTAESAVAKVTEQHAITQVLRRLADMDVLKIVEQGKGRRPTSYRIADTEGGSDSVT